MTADESGRPGDEIAHVAPYQPPRQSAFASRRFWASILACFRRSSPHWITENTSATVGKNRITRNITLVITLSVVSPYQPSPPVAFANASEANTSIVVLVRISAVTSLVRIARVGYYAALASCCGVTLAIASSSGRLKRSLRGM